MKTKREVSDQIFEGDGKKEWQQRWKADLKKEMNRVSE